MRKYRFAAVALAVLLSTTVVGADPELCPCVPTTPLWIVSSCPTWNCAISTLVSANGDPYVFAMPTGAKDGGWIVLRRVASGGYQDDGSEPRQIETFDGMTLASARFQAMPPEAEAMLVTAPDAKVLVLSLKSRTSRRPSTSH